MTRTQTIRDFLTRRWQFLIALVVIGAITFWVFDRIGDPRQNAEALEERAAAVQTIFNYAEAMLWFFIGAVLLCRMRSVRKDLRMPTIVAAITFLFFGGSDLAEVRTGAWFDPPWLLAWNAVCVTALILCYAWYAIRRKSLSQP